MIYFKKSKYRPYVLSVLAVSCALWALNACSHGESENGADTENAENVSDPNSPPLAGTDAAPGAGEDTAGTPPLPPGDGTAGTPPAPGDSPTTLASTSSDSPSDTEAKAAAPAKKSKGKKSARRKTKKSEPAVASNTDGSMSPDASAQTAAAAQTPEAIAAANAAAQAQPQTPPADMAAAAPQPVAQTVVQNEAMPPQAPPAPTQPNTPSTDGSDRTPASPRNDGAELGSGDGLGGMMDIWNNYRTMIMALAGIGLLCAGGYSFWKKRQEI